MGLHDGVKHKSRRSARITSIFFLCHPLVSLLYYIGILILVFTFNHPVFIMTAFILTFVQASYLSSLMVTIRRIKIYLLFGIVIAVLNPIFNHRGVTILFYLFDKPVTLESFFYGIYMFLLIVSMLVVFLSINQVLGMGKILYLFSSSIPQIAFIISMTLRYGELFKQQAQEYTGVQNARKSLKSQGKMARIKNAGNMLAGFFSSSLENGMVVSETLKAKEYGKHKRTHYQKYKMDGMDFVFLSLILMMSLMMMIGKYYGIGNIDYYTNLNINLYGKTTFALYGIYVSFFLLPLIIDGFYYVKRKCCYGIIKIR